MISINFLSINVDYVSIFIQGPPLFVSVVQMTSRNGLCAGSRGVGGGVVVEGVEGVGELSLLEREGPEVDNLCNLRLRNEFCNLLENRKSRRLDQERPSPGAPPPPPPPSIKFQLTA